MSIDNLCLGFVGLGLIGGSIAKTVKRIIPSIQIVAYNRTYSVLEAAKAEGAIDVSSKSIDETFSKCDYIFLCMPIDYNAKYLQTISKVMKESCIITDVGSVKTQIHETVRELGLEANFIGGHPMTGSEKTGYESSTDHLLENAYYLITPTESVDNKKVDEFLDLVRKLDSIPLVLDYREHDYYVSAISHAPHVIASSLVHMVKNNDNESEIMKTIAAGGFKDTTRIAAGSPIMWQQICMSNSANVCKVLDDYINVLQNAKEMFSEKQSEQILNFFDEAREYRSRIGSQPKNIQDNYALYCDIADETGAIAIFATLLAANKISIKNIGILHNREFEQGVLHVEFYNNTDFERAYNLLVSKNYKVTKS